MGATVIIEGADGSGKTTLSNYLVEKGFKYKHEGPPPKDGCMIEYYAVRLWKALHQRGPVVYDRFHLGEMVYGPIHRHNDRMGYYGMRMFLRIFKSQPVLCTVATPPWKLCVDAWQKKMLAGDDYLFDAKKFEDSYYKFLGLASYHSRFDYSAIEHLDNWYYNYFDDAGQFHDVHTQARPFPMGYIGYRSAKFLILGERTNATETDFPFINSHNSSRFLNEALWEAGYKEEEMAFGNTFNRRGIGRDLTKITKMLPNLKMVLAFGENARDAAEYYQLPRKYLTHPACFFRFHQKRRPDFIKQLKEIREDVYEPKCITS